MLGKISKVEAYVFNLTMIITCKSYNCPIVGILDPNPTCNIIEWKFYRLNIAIPLLLLPKYLHTQLY